MTDSSIQKRVGFIGEIVLDVHDLDVCGQFWSQVLGAGIKSREGQYLVLDSPPGCPGIILQQVTERKPGKNRVHVDLRVKDVDEALDQVRALGARKVREVLDPPERFIVATDPDGNEFCLVNEQA